MELILAPLHSKYGKNITIWWPVESRTLGDELVDFTRAYISLRPNKKFVRLQDADVILDFVNDYLRVASVRVPDNYVNKFAMRFFESREIPIANPNVHEEAIALISKIIDRVSL